MKVSRPCAAVVALSATAHARHLVHPEPTGIAALPLDGVSPRPTSPPDGGTFGLLFRRADDEEDQSILVAPDATCGYISGRLGAAYTCGEDATCVFLTSSAAGVGKVACCDDIECNYRDACVDFDDYFQSSNTDTTAPYCNTISFSNGIRDYWCNNVDISTPQMATTRYKGQTDSVSWAEVALTDSSTEISFVSTGTDDHGATVSAEAASDATATETSSKDDEGSKKDSNDKVGAIVGGVVGSVGAIGLIGIGVFFFLRHRGKKAAAAAAAPGAYQQVTPMMQQQPGSGPGGYNPVPQHFTGYYDPKNPYPSPGQQQQYPASVVGYYPGTPDPSVQTHPTPPPADPRLGHHVNASPAPSFNQQPVIHEAGGEPVKPNPHELA
ncbi:hypothetical protein ACJ41O_002254 [Fusarium nematophilum]